MNKIVNFGMAHTSIALSSVGLGLLMNKIVNFGMAHHI